VTFTNLLLHARLLLLFNKLYVLYIQKICHVRPFVQVSLCVVYI